MKVSWKTTSVGCIYMRQNPALGICISLPYRMDWCLEVNWDKTSGNLRISYLQSTRVVTHQLRHSTWHPDKHTIISAAWHDKHNMIYLRLLTHKLFKIQGMCLNEQTRDWQIWAASTRETVCWLINEASFVPILVVSKQSQGGQGKWTTGHVG